MITSRFIALTSAASVALAATACSGGGSGSGDSVGLPKDKGAGTLAPSPASGEMTGQQLFAMAAPATVQLYGQRGSVTYGGTGFIYDKAKGLVITNAHVVAGLGTLKARYGDDSETSATVVGSAPCSDIAVVRLITPNPSATQLEMGDSATVKPASHVSVLGYPSSFQKFDKSKVAFTEGSVQAAGVRADNIGADLPVYPDTIQHSATINHGNSGGPLLDTAGKVVGVNTLTTFGTGGQGQFYSIGINTVKRIVPTLEAGKSMANVGWSVLPLSEAPMKSLFPVLGWGDEALGQKGDAVLADKRIDGLVVLGLDSGSAAEAGNVEVGDIVRKMNGVPVTTVSKMCDVLESAAPGSTVGVDGSYTFTGSKDDAFGDPWTAQMKMPS